MKPLSTAAEKVLAQIAEAPVAARDVNFGIADRLRREGFIATIVRADPESLSGRSRFYKITPAGIGAAHSLKGDL